MGPILKVKGKDLPPEWAATAEARPEGDYTVYIVPEDPELDAAKTLSEFMRIVGERAARRGLTEEKLNEILNER